MDNVHTADKKDIGQMAKGTVFVGAGDLFGNFLFYLNSIVITRTIGAPLYGLYFLANIVILIGSMIARLGLDFAVLRFVALHKGKNEHLQLYKTINSGLLLSAIASVIIAVSIFISAPVLANHLFRKSELTAVMQILAIGIPFTNISAIVVNLFLGLKKVKYKILIENILLPLLKLCLIILFFMFGMKLSGVVYATLFSTFGISIYSLLVVIRRFPQIKTSGFVNDTSQLMSFSTPILGETLLNYFISWIDLLLLGYFATSSDVGILGIIFRISMVVVFVQYSFNAIFSPMISELYGTDKRDQLEHLFKLQTRWSVTFTLPLLILLILFPETVMSVFGESFKYGATGLLIVAIGRFSDVLVGASGLMIMMTGHPKINAVNSFIILAIKIALNLYLIPKFGLLGAAITSSATTLLLDITRVVQVSYILKIHPYDLKFLKPVIAAVTAVVIHLCAVFFCDAQHPDLLSITLFSILFLVVYFTTLYLLRLDADDKYILHAFRYKIFNFKQNNHEIVTQNP